jgi:hypothetical protein
MAPVRTRRPRWLETDDESIITSKYEVLSGLFSSLMSGMDQMAVLNKEIVMGTTRSADNFKKSRQTSIVAFFIPPRQTNSSCITERRRSKRKEKWESADG